MYSERKYVGQTDNGIEEIFFPGQSIEVQTDVDNTFGWLLKDDFLKKQGLAVPKCVSNLIQQQRESVEMYVTDLSHVTVLDNVLEMCAGEFLYVKGREKKVGDLSLGKLSWWGCHIDELDRNDVSSKRQLLTSLCLSYVKQWNREVDITGSFENIANKYKEVTPTICSSPLFDDNSSRYGNYEFRISFSHLIDSYKETWNTDVSFHFLGTFCYKLEAMRTLLVVPKNNEGFSLVKNLKLDEKELKVFKIRKNGVSFKVTSTQSLKKVFCNNAYNALTNMHLHGKSCEWENFTVAFYLGEKTWKIRKKEVKLFVCDQAKINLSKQKDLQYDRYEACQEAQKKGLIMNLKGEWSIK